MGFSYLSEFDNATTIQRMKSVFEISKVDDVLK